MNKTKVEILEQTGKYSNSVYLAQYLGRVVLMRTARGVGDVETISNTILGRLKDSGISFRVIV